VLLNNASFAYYKVTVQRDGREWGRFVLKPQQALLGAVRLAARYVVSQSISPGDGELAFSLRSTAA